MVVIWQNLSSPSFPLGKEDVADKNVMQTSTVFEPDPPSSSQFQVLGGDASKALGSTDPATELAFGPYDLPFMHSFFEKRMEVLRGLPDGWQGAGSLAATDETIDDAYAFLKRLVTELPDAPKPNIGLDSDGCIVLSWKNNRLIGNLSIFGDGTFSYYIEKDEDVAKAGEAKVASPLPYQLSEILKA